MDSKDNLDAAAEDDAKRKTGQKFVVVGCGMVGVFLAIELKRRFPHCSLTVLEKLSEGETTDGSWMIGLATPGLEALSNNPALLEKVKKSGRLVTSLKKSIHMNKHLVSSNSTDFQGEDK